MEVIAFLTLLANIFLALFTLFLVFAKYFGIGKTYYDKLTVFLRTRAMMLALLVSAGASAGSFYLSEVRELAPCVLCWYQRVFMYPIPFILGTAMYKGLKEAREYVLPLGIVGGAIALYHYYLQFAENPFLPCSAVGFSVSCSERFFTYFGYITIPWMSFSAFSLIVAGMLLVRKS